jgi:hypothetical protein
VMTYSGYVSSLINHCRFHATEFSLPRARH